MSHTTKLTVEIEVNTQFGPLDAIKLIDIATRMPAITEVKVIKIDSDYKPTFPKTELQYLVTKCAPMLISKNGEILWSDETIKNN